MGFKKVDCIQELENRCNEDKEITKHVEEFNKFICDLEDKRDSE